ncbi:MAG: hypothetical protein U0324_28105, partial [Polyangiales bacterium]
DVPAASGERSFLGPDEPTEATGSRFDAAAPATLPLGTGVAPAPALPRPPRAPAAPPAAPVAPPVAAAPVVAPAAPPERAGRGRRRTRRGDDRAPAVVVPEAPRAPSTTHISGVPIGSYP